MKATYAKHGADYLPAIRHDDGRIEVIHGDALADRPTAIKYARLHISDRRDGERARTTAAWFGGRARREAFAAWLTVFLRGKVAGVDEGDLDIGRDTVESYRDRLNRFSDYDTVETDFGTVTVFFHAATRASDRDARHYVLELPDHCARFLLEY